MNRLNQISLIGNKHNSVLLIVGLLLLGGGLWLDVQWYSFSPSLQLYLVNLLPGLAMLFLWFFGGKFGERRQTFTFIGVFFAIIVFIYAIFVNLGASVIAAATSPLEDISEYLEIREDLNGSHVISHFPESIPSDATNVRFIFIPGFLQGGTSIQLRYSLSQDEISEVLTYYRDNAKYVFYGGDSNDHVNQTNGVPTTFFHTSDINEGSFPNTFEVLVLDAEPLGTPEFEWNHGFSYGVAIDADNSIIVFWAEDW